MNKYFVSSALVFVLLLSASPAFATGVEEAKTGVELAQMGLGKLAANQFEAALKTKDLSTIDREKTLYNLGTTYLDTSRPDLALKAFDEALKLSPNETRTLINRAEALRWMLQNQESLKTLDKALALDSSLADAYFSRGLNLLAMDRSKDAENAFRSAKKKKSDPHYDVGLGRALHAQEKYKEAINALNEAIDNLPEVAEVYIYRSEAYLALGKRSESENDLKKALQFAPNDPLIRSYYETRRYGKTPSSYKTKADVTALASPKEGAPGYTKLPKGMMIESPTCKNGWCRVMMGRSLAGYLKKTDISVVAE